MRHFHDYVSEFREQSPSIIVRFLTSIAPVDYSSGMLFLGFGRVPGLSPSRKHSTKTPVFALLRPYCWRSAVASSGSVLRLVLLCLLHLSGYFCRQRSGIAR